MMKKLLFGFAVFMAGTAMMSAQFANIGILGGSTASGWSADMDMTTTDGIVYTYENLVITVPETDPGVKFRQDDAWTNNWGGSGFPSGTATSGGANIPATNGTYDVTFNLNTLQYNFTPADVEFDEVTVVSETIDFQLMTTDGVHYSYDNLVFEEDDSVAFMVAGSEMGWGSSGFPTGTAVEGGSISVPANSYNVDFNLDTKAYSFDFVTISLIGAGVVTEDPSWATDVDLTTADGVNYTLLNYTFPGGEAKFRLNHGWTMGWGSTEFPAGTGSTDPGAPNMTITAGTYDVHFNRMTGAYSFDEPTAGNEEFAAKKVTVYPNPAQNQWNFAAGAAISNIEITDMAGKVIYNGKFNSGEAAVDAGTFASGIYFAKVASGNAVTTVKVVKK